MTALRPFAAFVLLTWSPAFAQTICHDPPPGMSCPGDRLVWCNTPSGVYHFEGERYFGCTKAGKFLCEQVARDAPVALWLAAYRLSTWRSP
jgi:hypothetical protein